MNGFTMRCWGVNKRKPPSKLALARMIYRTYIPRPPLSGFVDLFWSYEGYDPPHARERVVPTGTMQLIFNLREDELRVYDRQDHRRFRSLGGSLISGAHSRFVVIDTASQASTVGVHFKAGGAHPFLGVSAGELRDADVPLGALWGTKANELRGRLLEARTPEARFRLLERALLSQVARRPLTHHPAVAFALEEFQSGPRAKTVKEVSGPTGLSQRRFIELFREEVGLTPKLFSRIRRFQEVISLLGSGPRAEWAEVALRCGYFDQAHLVHDFREFSGTTPTAYLANRGEHPNHVSL
jgi:AraC-like DNA-binding protein